MEILWHIEGVYVECFFELVEWVKLCIHYKVKEEGQSKGIYACNGHIISM